jgi:hypothetical protein
MAIGSNRPLMSDLDRKQYAQSGIDKRRAQEDHSHTVLATQTPGHQFGLNIVCEDVEYPRYIA